MDNEAELASHTWIQCCRLLGSPLLFADESMEPKDLALLDRFIQSAMENPEGFTRAFEPILGPGTLNPLSSAGAGVLANIIHNGINDDWELWLQWREQGYAVVNESQRKPSDQPFRAEQAIRILDLISGGARRAPGLANLSFWIQAKAELPYEHLHPRSKP